MLWDCPNCGTDKLLGLDHRHCPNCGGAQDPKWRYFPPDDQKVAVENHVFHGADQVCPACETPNAKVATFCAGCGSPLDEAKAAKTRGDQVVAEGAAFAADSAKAAKQDFAAQKAAAKSPPPAKPKSKTPLIIAAVVVSLIIALIVVLTWKRTATVTVAGHAWERTIAVERFQPTNDSAWCDQLPGDAYQVSRKQEVRDHKKVKDGEECSTRRKDQGDGTFKEARECKPKYRDEPVYADKCYYVANRWARVRTEKAAGAALAPPPSWPAFQLARAGQCLGCEREGPRSEEYKVLFKDDKDARDYDCKFAEAKWASYGVGTRFQSKVGVVTHSLDCDALQKP